VTPLPPTSVVICTRDRPTLLRATLESILAAEHVPDECVIVDQSDRPRLDLADSVKGATDVRVLEAAPRGLGRARNEGAAAARHGVLVFVDDDMLADPKWLGALVGALVEASPGAVTTGAVIAADAETWRGFTPSTQAHDPGAVFQGRIGRDVLAGGHMAIWRRDLDAVGGFDERLGAGAAYPAADDNDLGFRLLEQGYRIHYVADAILYHRAWRAGWRYPLVRWRYGRGKGGFYAKHRGVSDGYMRQRAAADVSTRMRRFPRLVLREPGRAVGDACYVAGVVVGGARWLLTERRD
jgi:GT2 family glycosyltransferase